VELNPGGVAAVLLLFGVLAFLHLPAKWRAWRRRRSARREMTRWGATKPTGPPASAEQLLAFREQAAALVLPSVQLEAAADEPARPGGTRIGGPAWLAEGEAWPCGRDGRPMEFLAQVDFGELPPLPDFPQAGLLQFFIARDDLFGADFDDASRSDVRLLWRPEAPANGPLHQQLPLDELDSSPFAGNQVRSAGRALRGLPSTRAPAPFSLPVDLLLRAIGIEDAANIDEVEDPYWDGEEPPSQFIGGHPRFIQADFRRPGFLEDYDRVLLQLESQNGLLWGDCGWAVFMIRRADLLARDFSRPAFYWDCS